VQRSGVCHSLQDMPGASRLAAAIAGEAIADAQPRVIGADLIDKGKICAVGLGRRSRHLNYVSQWRGWLAHPLIPIDLTGVERGTGYA